jgi:hypothetical protein
MPCNTIIKNSVELKVANQAVLKRALEADGWSVVERRGVIYATKNGRAIEIGNGKATVVQGNEDLVNKVKVAYSKQVVKIAAAKFGFKLQSVPGKQNTWDVIKSSS